jgi:hypothetical protein
MINIGSVPLSTFVPVTREIAAAIAATMVSLHRG